jgi:hypothetical protein
MLLSNLMLHLFDREGQKLAGAIYGKVVEVRPEASTLATIWFT